MGQLVELPDKSSLKVLGYFFNNPSSEISQKELQKKAKLAKATLIKSVGKLVKLSFLTERRVGVTKLLKLNNGNTLVKQFKIMWILLSLMELKKVIQKHNVKMYLYGSCARGEHTEESDIDLLIIGKTKKDELVGDIRGLSKKIGREIKPVIMDAMEWSKMAKNDKAFYEMVERDKIIL